MATYLSKGNRQRISNGRRRFLERVDEKIAAKRQQKALRKQSTSDSSLEQPPDKEGSQEDPLRAVPAVICVGCQLELFGRKLSVDEEVLCGPFGAR